MGGGVWKGDTVMMAVVALSSLTRILGECSTIHSPPALFLKVEISWRNTNSTLYARIDPQWLSDCDCGRVTLAECSPDKLRVSSFPVDTNTMPGKRHCQPTPTSLDQGCVRV